jgi:Rrf2 family cysteine metabolism transcriptional repressor
VKFSKKTEYGLLALIDMANHQQQTAGSRLTTHDIAARQGIPERFLEQQITALRNAGLVHSHRGAAGGCLLARRPEEISVVEVVEALEGAIFELGGADGDTGRPLSGAIRELSERARSALTDLFGSISIAELARREREIYEQASVMFYV